VQMEDSNDKTTEQAAAWVVRLQADPSAVDRERFEAWRAQGEPYARAYDLALTAWLAVGEHAAAPRLLAMRRDALERARKTSTRWDRRTVAAGLCFLILAPIAVLGWYRLKSNDVLEFQTRRGEQQVIVLPDGSRMSLDALSRVEVKYTSDVRGIELTAGRANFEVAKDVTRPLKVHSGPRTVTAIGTVFTVEREPREVVVTLVEGHVAVTSSDQPTQTMEMRPRQQLRMMDSGQVTLREGLDPAQALAWRLSRVVARMNNYSATPIRVEGPASGLHISGVFKAGDTAAFVDAMQSYFALTAQQQEDAITIRSKAGE
jgi:transmembrane sensor